MSNRINKKEGAQMCPSNIQKKKIRGNFMQDKFLDMSQNLEDVLKYSKLFW